MKAVVLSVSAAAALALAALIGTSSASAEVLVYPPNPVIGDPVIVLVTQGFGSDATLLVGVTVDPFASNPGPPNLELTTPAPGR